MRLGLWGRGTAFEDFKAFEEEINRAGVGMMEVWGRYGRDMGEIQGRYRGGRRHDGGAPPLTLPLPLPLPLPLTLTLAPTLPRCSRWT